MEILLVVLMYAGWSSIFSLGKWLLAFSSPLFLTAFRMLFAGVLLSSYVFFRSRFRLKITKKQLLSYALLGLISLYFTYALESWVLEHLSAAKTCFIYSLSPFFAAFFSYLHFGEKMTRKKWLGMLVGFLGFLPVLSIQTGSEDLLQTLGIFSLAELAIMGAALFSVYGWVLLRLLVKEENTSPLQANGFSMLFGGFFSLMHSYCIDTWNPTPILEGYAWPFLQGMFFMTLISNIICTISTDFSCENIAQLSSLSWVFLAPYSPRSSAGSFWERLLHLYSSFRLESSASVYGSCIEKNYNKVT